MTRLERTWRGELRTLKRAARRVGRACHVHQMTFSVGESGRFPCPLGPAIRRPLWRWKRSVIENTVLSRILYCTRTHRSFSPAYLCSASQTLMTASDGRCQFARCVLSCTYCLVMVQTQRHKNKIVQPLRLWMPCSQVQLQRHRSACVHLLPGPPHLGLPNASSQPNRLLLDH